MGYAKTTQMASGIHQRLWSRAFIISERPLVPEEEELQMATHVTVGGEKRAELKNKKFKRRGLWQWMTSPKQQPPAPSIISHLDPDKTICFVSIDAGMGSDILNKRVLKRINELMPQQVGNNKRLCHLENLSISGTHTHSAPAGFIQYTLYQITSAGFSEEVMTAYVEGIAQSIVRAYENLEEGQLTLGKSELFGANINRSPTSYLLNPKEERDQYKDIGDTDKTMMQLKFENLNGNATGILNWFPVHGTSMNSSNVLISGDNKGYASYSMEKNVNGQSTLPGTGPFVAAFASTNLGDVSPNTAGPRCIDTGLPCDVLTSTCGGDNGKCIAAGPGKDMIESTKIIGGMQVELAMSLLGNSSQLVEGPVGYRHSFLDMSNLTVVLDKNETARTCPAALGYSFAGGTTDGPGA
jgi:neutral ceramidase